MRPRVKRVEKRLEIAENNIFQSTHENPKLVTSTKLACARWLNADWSK